MSTIELPELRADSVVGFLAALGTVRTVAVEFGDSSATLCWPNGPYAPAELTTNLFHGTAELAARLFEQVELMRANKQLIPGIDELPIRAQQGAGSDPMRALSPHAVKHLAEQGWDDPRLAAWLTALVGISAPDKSGNLELTPMLRAGPGTVFVERTLRNLLEQIHDSQSFESAFASWRRGGTIGAYLDRKADIDKSRWPSTKDVEKYGEPTATWLAIQALPFFPVRATPAARPVGWGRAVESNAKAFHYPVWSKPLTHNGIAAVLDHPAVSMQSGSGPGYVNGRPADGLRVLGVTAIFESVREEGAKGPGAMGNPVELWRA